MQVSDTLRVFHHNKKIKITNIEAMRSSHDNSERNNTVISRQHRIPFFKKKLTDDFE